MGSKSPKSPALPTARELAPLIDLQAQYNRVGVETPFGSQNYRKNPDGTFTMVTDVGPLGRDLVGRAVGLGMTDSSRMGVPSQVNSIANALAGRVGSRFGLPTGEQFSLSPSPASPAQANKPQAIQAPPQASGLPQGIPPGMAQGGSPDFARMLGPSRWGRGSLPVRGMNDQLVRMINDAT